MRRLTSRQGARELVALYALLALMIAVTGAVSPAFRTGQNFINILNQMAPIGFVALGQTFAILTTGIDLSAGAIVSLTTVIAATFMSAGGLAIAKGLVLCLLAATAAGLVNGLIIAKLRVDPLITTLGTSGIIAGLTLIIMPYPGGYVPGTVTRTLLYEIGGVIPVSFLLFILTAFLCWGILSYTRFGRRVYAIGGDEEKARVAGIDVNRIKLGVYLVSAILASAGGMVLAARMRSGDPLAGAPFTLDSIAAVLVGGTTFAGGRGSIWGTVAGVAILALLRVILNIMGVSPFYQNVLSGAIIVIAVTYSSLK